MATYRISSTGAPGTILSLYTNTADAFFQGTASPDTLIVEAGAFLISEHTISIGFDVATGSGAVLTGNGAWTATIAGYVEGNQYGLEIALSSANVTVTEEGSILAKDRQNLSALPSDEIAVSFVGDTFTLTNKGMIKGDQDYAISMLATTNTINNSGGIFGSIFNNNDSGNDMLTNSGRIAGHVLFQAGTNKVTNSGEITGRIVLGSGSDTVSNTKTIGGHVVLDDGTNILTNGKGATIGKDLGNDDISVQGGIGSDTITNDGVFQGFVNLSEGTNKLTNGKDASIGKSSESSDGWSYYGESGSDTVVNNGNMLGGVVVGGGTNSLTNTGSIGPYAAGFAYNGGTGNDTVSNSALALLDGSVRLGDGGITPPAGGDLNKLTNAGTINGTVFAGNGNDTITNTGNINSGIRLGQGTNSLTSTGFVGSDVDQVSVLAGDGADTVISSMSLNGGVTLGNGQNSFSNSGRVRESTFGWSYLGGQNNDTVTNSASGVIVGTIFLENATNISPTVAGLNTLTNSGVIHGDVFGGQNNDTITNTSTGKIDGDVYLGNAADITPTVAGRNILINSGKILGYVIGGNNNDAVTNNVTGRIDGDVGLWDGNDTYTNNGFVQGLIDMGAGDDTFTGGNFGDRVKDALGKDTINLGGGNDTFLAVFSAGADSPLDRIDGQTGVDTYNATDAAGPVFINLGTATHQARDNYTFNSDETLLKNEARFGTAEKDLIFNFENAIGTENDDILAGSSAVNDLRGGGGVDDLFGYDGNDTIVGGAGGDNIVGGRGADILTGGLGDGNGDAETDLFYYFNKADSGTTRATRDSITDFRADGDSDKIILELMDANDNLANDQNFNFIGTNVNWGGNAGELRSIWTVTGQIIEGDTNADRKADFSIFIADVDGVRINITTVNVNDYILL